MRSTRGLLPLARSLVRGMALLVAWSATASTWRAAKGLSTKT